MTIYLPLAAFIAVRAQAKEDDMTRKQELISMFTANDEGDVVRAIINNRDRVFFRLMGFVDTVNEVNAPAPKEEINGDKGSGEVGSRRWHLLYLKEFKTEEEVFQHVLATTERELHKKPNESTKAYKQRALNFITEVKGLDND